MFKTVQSNTHHILSKNRKNSCDEIEQHGSVPALPEHYSMDSKSIVDNTFPPSMKYKTKIATIKSNKDNQKKETDDTASSISNNVQSTVNTLTEDVYDAADDSIMMEMELPSDSQKSGKEKISFITTNKLKPADRADRLFLSKTKFN